jgi:hypothetical protein
VCGRGGIARSNHREYQCDASPANSRAVPLRSSHAMLPFHMDVACRILLVEEADFATLMHCGCGYHGGSPGVNRIVPMSQSSSKASTHSTESVCVRMSVV